jgi:hypothetical protein
MGIQQIVTFGTAPPAWTGARDVLAARGYKFQICMIDGQLIFPDEQPSDNWNELRFQTPHGMITVRREANRLVFVIWGNADVKLREELDAFVSAFAEAGGGSVEAKVTD